MAEETPNVGFIVHNPNNKLGLDETKQNIQFLENYLAATEGVEWEGENFRRVVRRLAMQSAHYSEVCINNIVGGCWLLHTWLPRLKEYGLKSGLINYAMLRTIWNGLVIVPMEDEYAEVWELLDIFLVECLSPVAENQVPPTAHWMRKKIRDELVRIGAYQEFEDPNTGKVDFDPPVAAYGVELIHTNDPSVTMLQVTMPTADAYEASNTIAADAKDAKMRLDQVVMNRLCGEEAARENVREVRIYGVGEPAQVQDFELVYADGQGQVTDSQRESLMKARVVKYRSIDEVAAICREDHDPTEDQTAVARLRDGTCKFPGCNVDARFCDIDHVINWEAGGWTTLSNLQCLCRTHHNFKTDRNIRAHSDVYGVITWEMDGIEVASVPNGPLAGSVKGLERGVVTRHTNAKYDDEHYAQPPSRNGLGRWGLTLRKYRANQRKRHIEQMTLRKRQLRDYDDIPPVEGAA
ncbi:MAG: HNH endonuclease signature motif containing protein [Corynebacterium sp.]|nr:HNH endonuclease signature motif containing protein [Corynebacterium sp.]